MMKTNTVAVLLLSVVIADVKSLAEQEWISAEVNSSSLQSVTNVIKEVFEVTNLRHCLGLATNLDWAYLACFSSSNEGVCTLWDIEALGYGLVKKSGNLDHSECKVRRDVTGCFKPGKIAALGELIPEDFCPVNLYNSCTEKGLELQVLAPPLTTCDTSAGFVDVSGMCLLFVTTTTTWCAARAKCRSLGADMASFETADDFQVFRSYMDNNGIGGHSFVGLTKDDQSNWSWMFFGRDPGAYQSGDWAPNNFNSYQDLCATVTPYDSYHVGATNCDSLNPSICRAYL